MKQKIYRPSIILFLVAIAFFVKGTKDKEYILYAVGFFIFVLAFLRSWLISSFQKISDETELYEDRILEYLNKDPILYVEMIEVYRRDNFKLMYQEIDGLLFYDYESLNYLGSAMNLEAARDIVRMIPSDFGTFVAHDFIFEEAVELDLKVKSQLRCYNYVYVKRKKYEIEPGSNLEFSLLNESHMDIIKKHYTIRALCTDAYIMSCIKRGVLGAYDKGELAGFIGQHSSGSLGMLEIFEPFRKRNIATLLECSMINHLIENSYEGAIFGQVNAENKVSMHLQEKLEFEKSKTATTWYFS